MTDADLIKMEQRTYSDTMRDGIVETLAGIFFLFTTLMVVNPAFNFTCTNPILETPEDETNGQI